MFAGAASAVSASRRLGLYVVLRDDPATAIAQARSLGFSEVEIYNDNFAPAFADRLAAALEKHRVAPVSLFSMGPGPMVWNFIDGPRTVGLVPREHRRARVRHLIDASEFARKFRIPRVETHCGFIPEDPGNPLYPETVEAIREAAGHCRGNRQEFLYHAGQETAATLLRIIEDVGLDNQRIGFDTANPVTCSTGSPVDFAEMLGRYLSLVNFKDGLFPTDGRRFGRETPIGQGKVQFRDLMTKLKQVGYSGPLLIEREISGPQFEADIRASKLYLERLAREAKLFE